MRKLCMRGVALAGALGLAVTLAGCGSDNETKGTAAAGDSQTAASTEPSATAEESTAPETSEKDRNSSAVASIEEMVTKLQSKHYACAEFKQVDVPGATKGGTCNGEDQIMWFDSADGVNAKKKELDEAGTGYVWGENWIVANTVTPTFVRNALDGETVAGSAKS